MSLTIETSLSNVTNEFDLRAQQVMDLVQTYIGEFKGIYKGWRSLGHLDIVTPAFMVEPTQAKEEMLSTGKYHIYCTFVCYFYIFNNDPDAVAVKSMECMAALTKLFSNNALNDLGSGNTSKFKANPGYWVNSEIREIKFSSTVPAAKDSHGERWGRAGRFTLEVFDVVIK